MGHREVFPMTDSQCFQWTPEVIAKMFSLIDEGYSLYLVGKELGCGKNAVVGKFNRERRKRGIPIPRRAWRRPVVQKSDAPRKPRKVSPPKSPAFIAKLVIARATPKRAAKGVSIIDVTGCRWPIADAPNLPGGFAFCNAPQCDRSSYCEEHRQENVAGYSQTLITKTIKSALKANKQRAA